MKIKICEFCSKGELVLIQDRLGLKGTDDRVGWRNKVWKCNNCKSQIREEIYDEINQQHLLDGVIRLLGDLTKESLKTLKEHIDHHLIYNMVKCIDNGGDWDFDKELLQKGQYYKILKEKMCFCGEWLVDVGIKRERDITCCGCGKIHKGIWFYKKRFKCGN